MSTRLLVDIILVLFSLGFPMTPWGNTTAGYVLVAVAVLGAIYLTFGFIRSLRIAIDPGRAQFAKTRLERWVKVGSLLLIAAVFVLAALNTWPLQESFVDWPSRHIERERRTHFINETVVLDGKSYWNCTFENVTFRYNGTAPFQITECKAKGTWGMDSRNHAINDLLGFMQYMGFIPNSAVLKTPIEDLD